MSKKQQRRTKTNQQAESESLARYAKQQAFGYTLRFTEMLELGKSSHGAWSRKQLKVATGTKYPKTGWRRKREGLFAPDSVAAEFIALKDRHLSSKDSSSNSPPPPKT